MNKVERIKHKENGNIFKSIKEKLFRKRKLDKNLKNELKGFRIWSLEEPKFKKGLAVRTYNDLLSRIKTKFAQEVTVARYIRLPAFF